MSDFVYSVIGQFQFLKRYRLLLELWPSENGVWVDVDMGGEGRISFSRHEPRWPVVSVPVALVVHRDDVHRYNILLVTLQPAEGHAQGGEHTSEKKDVYPWQTFYIITVSNSHKHILCYFPSLQFSNPN